MNTNDEILVFEDANGNELKVDTAKWKLRKGTREMNANELADELHKIYIQEAAECWDVVEEAATMLRQQQAEIEALKRYKPNQTLECSFDLAGLKPPAKTLTDEEILNIAHQIRLIDRQTADDGHLYFARAVIKEVNGKC